MTLFDYPDPLLPGDMPLKGWSDFELDILLECWRKDLTF